jgi:putative phosphoribosyl transferase
MERFASRQPDLRAAAEEVGLRVGPVELAGRRTVPEGASGLVVFAHGSGSSRHSPRNRYVAEVLNQAGLATLLFDLLTAAEEPQRARVFDIELLAGRLAEVTRQSRHGFGRVGYFGASTGSAAALWAAADPDADIAAVVSRGGRPDLAAARLGAVRAPTLLIVGGADTAVLDLNRRAQAMMRCPAELAVVPGAGHLFEEQGALATVAGQARDWFLRHAAG